jgi:hypothetical protein
MRVVDKRRLIGWLIPLLYGIAIGIFVAWAGENLVPGRGAVAKYVFELFGIAALLTAILLKSHTGYNWPWEGQAEWAEAEAIPAKRYLRNFALWAVIVVVLLALFTLLQFRFNWAV